MNNNFKGFTLIEVLISIVIMAIIASVAMPGFQQLIASERVRTATNDIYFSLANARSEAMKRNSQISIIPTSSSTWNDGWSIQTTTGTNYSIQKNQALNSAIQINGPMISATTSSIIYNGSGRLVASSSNMSFVVYSSTQSTINARCISINLNGMPEIKKDSDGNYSNGCQ